MRRPTVTGHGSRVIRGRQKNSGSDCSDHDEQSHVHNYYFLLVESHFNFLARPRNFPKKRTVRTYGTVLYCTVLEPYYR